MTCPFGPPATIGSGAHRSIIAGIVPQIGYVPGTMFTYLPAVAASGRRQQPALGGPAQTGAGSDLALALLCLPTPASSQVEERMRHADRPAHPAPAANQLAARPAVDALRAPRPPVLSRKKWSICATSSIQ
jgi:hypothetical protein